MTQLEARFRIALYRNRDGLNMLTFYLFTFTILSALLTIYFYDTYDTIPVIIIALLSVSTAMTMLVLILTVIAYSNKTFKLALKNIGHADKELNKRRKEFLKYLDKLRQEHRGEVK